MSHCDNPFHDELRSAGYQIPSVAKIICIDIDSYGSSCVAMKSHYESWNTRSNRRHVSNLVNIYFAFDEKSAHI